MSFPKRTRSVTQQKKSFEKRICDDLCEELLAFLTFDDRFRLESVSKQFRRTIFRRQRILDLDNKASTTNVLNGLITNFTANTQERYHRSMYATELVILEDEEVFAVDCNRLKTVLKKAVNIREINFGHKTYKNDICIKNIDEVLQTIIESDLPLASIGCRCDCYSMQIDSQITDAFVAKFGQSLRSIEFPEKFNTLYRFCKLLTKRCPNLLSINGIRFKHFIEENRILAKNVTKLKQFAVGSTDHESYGLFVKHFNARLVHLAIDFIPEDSDEEYKLLNSLSQFKCLKVLEISSKLYFRNTSNHLIRCLHSIANNCHDLKRFKFDVYIRDSMNGKSFSNCFEGYRSLKRLEFICLGLDLTNGQNLSLNSLKSCQHLTHLRLSVTEIDDHFARDLELIAPNLVEFELEIRCDLTDEAIEYISRLKRLKSVKITVRTNLTSLSLTESKSDLRFDEKFKNCPKFEKFIFNKF